MRPVTFYPDLSPYSYDPEAGASEDLNVGWLAAGHDYTRGAVPSGFVDALLMCATRPVRLYRGIHRCELCREPQDMAVDGREVGLGNGEIRVCASDRRWYAAPTLVAHYVAHHEYRPPRPFVDAVVAQAQTLHVVRGEQLARFAAMTSATRLETCIAVLRDLAGEQLPTIEFLVPRILDSATGDSKRDVWRNGWKGAMPGDLQFLDERMRLLCVRIVGAFSRQHDYPDDRMRDRLERWAVIALVESAADHGRDASRY